MFPSQNVLLSNERCHAYPALKYLNQAEGAPDSEDYASLFFFFFFLGESPVVAGAGDFSALSAFFLSFLAFRSASVSPSSYACTQRANTDITDKS